MIRLSFDNFVDKSTIISQEKAAEQLSKYMFDTLRGNKCAKFYINACAHYFKPLDDNTYGFGSAEKEFEVNISDDKNALKEKVLEYLHNRFTEEISYNGGYDKSKKDVVNIDRFGNW